MVSHMGHGQGGTRCICSPAFRASLVPCQCVLAQTTRLRPARLASYSASSARA